MREGTLIAYCNKTMLNCRKCQAHNKCKNFYTKHKTFPFCMNRDINQEMYNYNYEANKNKLI